MCYLNEVRLLHLLGVILRSPESPNLCIFSLQELIEDFIFPASKLIVHVEKTKEPVFEKAIPVCNTPQTLDTAFDLLVTLCIGCPPNLKLVVNMLCDMFYTGTD